RQGWGSAAGQPRNGADGGGERDSPGAPPAAGRWVLGGIGVDARWIRRGVGSVDLRAHRKPRRVLVGWLGRDPLLDRSLARYGHDRHGPGVARGRGWLPRGLEDGGQRGGDGVAEPRRYGLASQVNEAAPTHHRSGA